MLNVMRLAEPWLGYMASRHQNRHLKCFSSKVMVKDIFSKLVANVTHSRTSHDQTAQDVY